MAYWVSGSSQFSEPVHGTLIEWSERFPDRKQLAELSRIFSQGKRAFLPEELPSVLTLGRPYRSLPEAFTSDGGVKIVSQKIKDIIESLDGELHQYWPIDVVNQDKSKFDDAQRFGLNVHFTQDSIIDEKSDVINNRFSPDHISLMYINDIGLETKIYLDSSGLKAVNIWRERRYPGLLMLSDDLHAKFTEANINFLPYFYAHEI